MKNSYTEFSKDIEKYLVDKLPDVDTATAAEIGVYLSSRTSILIQDMMNDYAKRVEKQFMRKRRVEITHKEQLAMAKYMHNKLKSHIGHNVACVCYGNIDDPADVCIECEDCCEVLLSAEDFDLED